jgi:hypothetical protein
VRRLVDGEESQVALAWRSDLDDPRTEEFVGIVRGRTVQSSRGDAKEPAPKEQPAKRQAPPRQKRRAGRRRR